MRAAVRSGGAPDAAPAEQPVDALRGRLRVRAGHNLPILVTVAAAGPLRFAGAAARTALTSPGRRGEGERADGTMLGRVVRRAHHATRAPGPGASPSHSRGGAAQASRDRVTCRRDPAFSRGQPALAPMPAARSSSTRACRGASEAEGAAAAPVTKMGRLWPARTRSACARRRWLFGGRGARRPSRFAMPRRAPRPRTLRPHHAQWPHAQQCRQRRRIPRVRYRRRRARRRAGIARRCVRVVVAWRRRSRLLRQRRYRCSSSCRGSMSSAVQDSVGKALVAGRRSASRPSSSGGDARRRRPRCRPPWCTAAEHPRATLQGRRAQARFG